MAATTADATESVRWTKIRSDLANTRKLNPDADVTELQRDLKAARLAEHIQKTVESAPPLTDEQRERLALLLRGGAANVA